MSEPRLQKALELSKEAASLDRGGRYREAMEMLKKNMNCGMKSAQKSKRDEFNQLFEIVFMFPNRQFFENVFMCPKSSNIEIDFFLPGTLYVLRIGCTFCDMSPTRP